MGFLRGNFWSRDFLRFCWKPSAKDCLGVLIFAPIRPSPPLEKQEHIKEELLLNYLKISVVNI